MQPLDISNYIAAQLHNFFPNLDLRKKDIEIIEHVLPMVKERYRYCASKNMMLNGALEVDFFDIRKYPIFLYFLYHTIHKLSLDDEYRIKDRLYCLNKYLHGCSLFYKIDLPRVFFITYASQIILAKTTYGENLVFYHGVTVGTYKDKVPTIGSNVVLMPNVIISGSSIVGDNVVISTGVRVINQTVPNNKVVFQGERNSLVFKDNDGSCIRSFLCV